MASLNNSYYGTLTIGNLSSATTASSATTNQTISHNGSTVLSAGFIYAPYVPLYTTTTSIAARVISEISHLIAIAVEEAGFKVVKCNYYLDNYYEIFWRGKYLGYFNDNNKTTIVLSIENVDTYFTYDMHDPTQQRNMIKLLKRKRVGAKHRVS